MQLEKNILSEAEKMKGKRCFYIFFVSVILIFCLNFSTCSFDTPSNVLTVRNSTDDINITGIRFKPQNSSSWTDTSMILPNQAKNFSFSSDFQGNVEAFLSVAVSPNPEAYVLLKGGAKATVKLTRSGANVILGP